MFLSNLKYIFGSGNSTTFDLGTTENQFAEWIDHTTTYQKSQLTDFLYERHPVYEGRTTNMMIRMRGYAMSRFEQIGLPSTALPYVLEALESSFDPYMVSAAAKALRGTKAPHPQTAVYLVKAIYNIWQHDQPISFEQYHVKWPLKTYTTALIEIFTTIKWMGSYAQKVLRDLELILTDFGHHLNKTSRLHLNEAIQAIKSDDREVNLDCCKLPLYEQNHWSDNEQNVTAKSFPNLILEDQQGTQIRWGDFFQGKPTLLAFFYTRCRNPRKCTLTIHKLALIQNELKEQNISDQIKIAAVTYDPDHDTAGALQTYGLGRKFLFDENNKMFRVPNDFSSVVRAFDLGVNFNQSLVNQHRIELYLLNKDGSVERSFLRLQTETKTIINSIKEILDGKWSTKDKRSNFNESRWRFKTKANGVFSVLLSVMLAFFPKCPICWAAYLGAFGVSSLQSIPYSPSVILVLAGTMVLNLFLLLRTAKVRNGLVPFWVTLFGFLSVSLGYLLSSQTTSIIGIIMIFIGAIINSLSFRQWSKVNLIMSKQISLVGIKIRKSKTEHNIVYKQ